LVDHFLNIFIRIFGTEQRTTHSVASFNNCNCVLCITIVTPKCTTVSSKKGRSFGTPSNEAADLQGFIISAYGPVRNYVTSWQNDVCSDEFCIPGRPNGWVDGGVFQRQHLHNFQATEEGGTWNNGYAGIQRCNQILDFMIASGRVKLDPVEEKKVVAEMKALRAFYHAWILVACQNAPFVAKFSSDTRQAQLAPAALFDSIVNDLKAVVPDLQAPSTALYGRMNKYSAAWFKCSWRPMYCLG